MGKSKKCQSLETLIKEIGGVLKTVRTLRKERNGSYHVSNLYRWRERGYIPPSYWRAVIQLSNEKVTMDQLLDEFEAVHPF